MPYEDGLFYCLTDDDYERDPYSEDVWDMDDDPYYGARDDEYDEYDYEPDYADYGEGKLWGRWWDLAWRGTADIERAMLIFDRFKFGITGQWRRHWRQCNSIRYAPCVLRRA